MKIFWSVLAAGAILIAITAWVNEQNNKEQRTQAFERQLFNEFSKFPKRY